MIDNTLQVVVYDTITIKEHIGTIQEVWVLEVDSFVLQQYEFSFLDILFSNINTRCNPPTKKIFRRYLRGKHLLSNVFEHLKLNRLGVID